MTSDAVAGKIAMLQAAITTQSAELKRLREALEGVDCTCTVAERESGHKLECYMPDVIAALQTSKQDGNATPASPAVQMEQKG